MAKYIPIYQYAKNLGTTRQNVYRWIREGKIKAEDIKKEEVCTERIRIREDAGKITTKV